MKKIDKAINLIYPFMLLSLLFACDVERQLIEKSKNEKIVYCDSNNTIWVSDLSGKTKINTYIKEGYAYGWDSLLYGVSSPLLSQDGRYIAYIDGDKCLSIYDLKTKKNRKVFEPLDKYIEEVGDYLGIDFDLSGWLNDNTLLFYISLNLGPGIESCDYVDEIIKKVELNCFYTFDLNTNKIQTLPELKRRIETVPGSNYIVTYKYRENETGKYIKEMYLFNYIENNFVKVNSSGMREANIDFFDINNVIYYGNVDNRYYIIYQNFENGVKDYIQKGGSEDYSNPKFLSPYIVAYKRINSSGGKDKIILYNLKNKNKKTLDIKFDTRYNFITKKSCIIYIHNNNLYSYNIKKNKTFLIHNNIYIQYDEKKHIID